MEDHQKTYKMLQKSILIADMPLWVIAPCLKWDNFHPDHIDFLSGAIAGEPGKTKAPKWLVKAIYLERLEIVFTEHEKGIVGKYAGNADILNLLHSYMQLIGERPEEDWFNSLYLWCFQQVAEKYHIPHSLLKTRVDYSDIRDAHKEFGETIRHKAIARQRVEYGTATI